MVQDRLRYAAGDVLWVHSLEYPASVGNGSGYHLWVVGEAGQAPCPRFSLVTGWELAAGGWELIRLRTVGVPAWTTPVGWRQPPRPRPDEQPDWAQPTRLLPTVAARDRMPPGVPDPGRTPLMTPLARQRTTPIPGDHAVGGRHAPRDGGTR